MYTKRRFRTNRLKGNILQMDAETLGFKDASFDFIWSWGVIHHSEDTERIVSEIYRVLKPGGKAAIMVYNKDSIHFWISLVIIRGMLCAKLITHSVQEICNRYSDGLIAKYYTPGQIKKIFRSSGFNEIKVTVYGQKADCYPLPHNLKMRIIPFIPGSITNWLAGNFGRFIYLTALKPA